MQLDPDPKLFAMLGILKIGVISFFGWIFSYTIKEIQRLFLCVFLQEGSRVGGDHSITKCWASLAGSKHTMWAPDPNLPVRAVGL